MGLVRQDQTFPDINTPGHFSPFKVGFNFSLTPGMVRSGKKGDPICKGWSGWVRSGRTRLFQTLTRQAISLYNRSFGSKSQMRQGLEPEATGESSGLNVRSRLGAVRLG